MILVKMRGLAADEALMTIDYFVVLDRLYGTLNEKMRDWLAASTKISGLFGIGKNKMMLNDLMVERLLVAYDLAAALRYIHDQRYDLFHVIEKSFPQRNLSLNHTAFCAATDWYIAILNQKILDLTFVEM